MRLEPLLWQCGACSIAHTAVRCTCAVAQRVAHTVLMGAVEGEERGEGAMQPPISHADDLFWLRDDERKDGEVLAHLAKENAFTAAQTRHLAPLHDAVYEKLVSRMRQTDVSIPRQRGSFAYASRTFKGKPYSVRVRVALPGAAGSLPWPNPDSGEQVLLDGNVLGADLAHCDIAGALPSPCDCVYGYAIDTVGEEHYDLRFKWVGPASDGVPPPLQPDAANKEAALVFDEIKDTTGEWEWGDGRDAVFYTTHDDTDRPYQVWRHILGTPQSADVLIFQEDDGLFRVGVAKSSSGRFLFVTSCSITTYEEHVLDLCPTGFPQGGLPLPTALPSRAATCTPADLVCLAPREEHVKYEAVHVVLPGSQSVPQEEAFLIVTNRGGAINGRLVLAPVDNPSPDSWRVVLGHRHDVEVQSVSVQSDFVTIEGREGGLPQLWVMPTASIPRWSTLSQAVPAGPCGSPEQQRQAAAGPLPSDVSSEEGPGGSVTLWRVPVQDSAFYLQESANAQWDSPWLRYWYTAPTRPWRMLELDVPKAVAKGGLHVSTTHMAGAAPAVTLLELPLQCVSLVAEKRVPNVDPDEYACKRTTLPARDGTLVPVTLVWKPAAMLGSAPSASVAAPPLALPPSLQASQGFPQDAPVYLEAYGSYGSCEEAYFSSHVCTLADAGLVYATAHIRGGGEMGRAWYELQGKFFTKQNTFTDFIDVAQGLVQCGIASPGRIVAYGASAGGLVVGNALNRAPQLWAGAVADVPFVDLLVTMCDPSIPLTQQEWLEWGNPNVKVSSDALTSGLCLYTRMPAAHMRHLTLHPPPSCSGFPQVHGRVFPHGQHQTAALPSYSASGRLA